MQEKIQSMREGGKKLAAVKKSLKEACVPGVRFEELEALAQKRIKEEGAVPSFSTVPGYHHATCITKNEGCCHGVPVGHTVEKGDVIKIDVGLIWNGYHLDTSSTYIAGGRETVDPQVAEFVDLGWEALEKAIAKARVGNSIYDISKTMQDTVEGAGYSAVYQLTGHTIGKHLHEEPQVPCIAYRSDKKHKLFEGQTLAIEVMDAMGDAFLKLGADGWTYETKDKSMTGMFEETVLITAKGPEILTR